MYGTVSGAKDTAVNKADIILALRKCEEEQFMQFFFNG